MFALNLIVYFRTLESDQTWICQLGVGCIEVPCDYSVLFFTTATQKYKRDFLI